MAISLAAGTVVLVLLLGTGLGWWSGGSAEDAGSAPLSVSTSLTPGTTFFGDPIAARVVVGLDPGSVSASTLTVQPDFAPYVLAGPPVIRRSRTGNAETVSYTYSIQCDTDGCLPTSGPATIRFRPVVAAVASGAKRLTARGAWPAVVVSSRLGRSDLQASKPPFRHPSTVPAPVFGVDPSALADGLTVAAGLLGAGVLALLAFELAAYLRRRRALAAPGRLAVAVAFVRESAARENPADRRKALELLAEALDANAQAGLAATAGDAAWAEPAPTPARARELADEAESLPGEPAESDAESLAGVPLGAE